MQASSGRHPLPSWLKWTVLGWIVLITLLCLLKFSLFRYDGIDLGYFSQAAWNSGQGRLFAQSIHPHLTLGDHAELLLLPVSLIYRLLSDPRTLLALQAIVLGLCAVPLYRLAKHRCAPHSHVPALIALLWLLSPLVHSVALFEFHILPLALLPLFYALVAYQEERKLPFLAWILTAMLAREDVSLAVAGIGLLAFAERKPWWWRIAPITLGAAWFIAATATIGHFAPDGAYKFLIYYSWLGNSFGSVLWHSLTQPIVMLRHVWSLGNLEMAIGLLMPTLFAPLLAPSGLLLALGPLAIVLLGAPGGSDVIVSTHYAALFLPGIFLASIDGLCRAEAWLAQKEREYPRLRQFAAGATLTAALFSAWTLGPVPGVLAAAWSPSARQDARDAREAVDAIPSDAAVAASYRALPGLSSRERLYSLHYLFLGVTQFAAAPYPAPADLDALLIDTNDFRLYRAQFLRTGWARPHYDGGFERLHSLAAGHAVRWHGTFATVDLRLPAAQLPPPLPLQAVFADGIHLTGLSWERRDEQWLLRTAWEGAAEPESLLIDFTSVDGASTHTRSFVGGMLEHGLTQKGAVRADFAFPAGALTPRPQGSLRLYRQEELVTLDHDRSMTLVPVSTTELGHFDF